MAILGGYPRPMVLTFSRQAVTAAGEPPDAEGTFGAAALAALPSARSARPEFEVDHTAPVTLADFMSALAVFSVKASDEAKRDTLFAVFDHDGTGDIEEDDIRRVMLQGMCLRGVPDDDQLVDTLVEGTYGRCCNRDQAAGGGFTGATLTRARFDQLMTPQVLDRVMTIAL